ncbi:Uncharacterised protein [Vibrio cholerae]|nr:Uncharacterised protein [Vibrio cholerae]
MITIDIIGNLESMTNSRFKADFCKNVIGIPFHAKSFFTGTIFKVIA